MKHDSDRLVYFGHLPLGQVTDKLSQAFRGYRRDLLDEHQSRLAADLDFWSE